MKREVIIILLLLGLSGCRVVEKITPVDRSIPVIWHDDERGVTCYSQSYAIACIPDKELSR